MNNILESERAIEPATCTLQFGIRYSGLSESSLRRLVGLNKVKAVKGGGVGDKRLLLVFPSLKAHLAGLKPAKLRAPTRRKRKGA